MVTGTAVFTRMDVRDRRSFSIVESDGSSLSTPNLCTSRLPDTNKPRLRLPAGLQPRRLPTTPTLPLSTNLTRERLFCYYHDYLYYVARACNGEAAKNEQ